MLRHAEPFDMKKSLADAKSFDTTMTKFNQCWIDICNIIIIYRTSCVHALHHARIIFM